MTHPSMSDSNVDISSAVGLLVGAGVGDQVTGVGSAVADGIGEGFAEPDPQSVMEDCGAPPLAHDTPVEG